MIPINLPTDEFLKLRCVSRSMATLFTSPAFWKSRFSLSHEQGFLHDIPQKNWKSADDSRRNESSTDWRLLYHCSNPTTKTERDGNFRLQIRRGFWQINRWLAQACFMRVRGDGKGNQCTKCTYKTDGCIAGTYCYTQDPKSNKDIYIGRFLVKMVSFLFETLTLGARIYLASSYSLMTGRV